LENIPKIPSKKRFMIPHNSTLLCAGLLNQ